MAKFISYKDGGKTDEKGISQHLAGLFQGEVINGMAVTQNSPLGMSVLVSKGRVMIDSGSDYPYLGFTDANEAVTITTADGSNPRIDAIVAYVDLSVVDSTNANNPDAFLIVAVPGTPAGSPNAPNDGAVESAIGLGNPFIRLAHVTVGTGVTTITNGNISDQRVMVSSPDDFIGNSQIKGGAIDTRTVNFSSGIWWEELGRTTLTSAGDIISITGLSARKYLRLYIETSPMGGTNDVVITFNSDTGNNYAIRIATNGAADSTSTSRANLSLAPSTAGVPNFITMDVLNVANREKAIYALVVGTNTSGAGTAPERRELVGKWSNTSNQITRIDVTNATGSGDFAIGSELIVLGHD